MDFLSTPFYQLKSSQLSDLASNSYFLFNHNVSNEECSQISASVNAYFTVETVILFKLLYLRKYLT